MILTLRNRLKILIYIGAAVILVVSAFEGETIPRLSISRLSVVEAVLILLIGAFDRYVWRWPGIPRLLKTGPVLRGTWRGIIRPTTGDQTERQAFLSIRQTYSGIAFRLMTEESTSESTGAQLTQQADGLAVCEYFFQNTPRDSVRGRSAIHFGAARLEAVGQRPTSLTGAYFTSRQSSGELDFTEHRPGVAHVFDDARKLFEESK